MGYAVMKIVILFLTVAVLIFLWVVLRALNKKNHAFKDYRELDAGLSYPCPKCGRVMENGFVTAGKGIIFRASQEKPAGQILNTDALLDNTINMTFSSKENLAFRCRDCQYVLIDHSCLVGKVTR